MKSYRIWLKQQINEDSPIGDLAKDSFNGNWKGNTAKSLSEHMEKKWWQVCDEAREAFIKSKEEYRFYKNTLDKSGNQNANLIPRE